MDKLANFEERFFELLPKDLNIDRSQLTRDARLEAIGLDSLAVMELIFEIEDHFDIRLEQAASYPKTLGEVFDQIQTAIDKVVKADTSTK